MTLYELNQAGYASLPTMDEEAIHEAKTKLYQFISVEVKHYIMINWEQRSVTMFEYNGYSYPTLMANEILDVISTYGELKAIEVKDDIVELWVTEPDNICRMYAVFAYDQGVIQV